MTTFIDDAVIKNVNIPLNTTPFLKAMWDFIFKHNPGKLNTYHNNLHMYRMAGIAVFLLQESDEFKKMSPGDQHRSELLVLITCLWHDFDHSGGLLPDAYNIDAAVSGMMDYLREHGMALVDLLQPADSTTGELARSLVDIWTTLTNNIRVTEWPFVRNPTNIMEECIRDADLLYTYGSDTGEVVYGLYQELKTAGKFPKEATFAEFMVRQAEFINGCEFFTPKAKELHASMKDQILQDQIAYSKTIQE